MLTRLRLSRSFLACLSLAGFCGAGCGGSSSETPPPLSPDPLNDPYRSSSDLKRRAGVKRADPNAESGALAPRPNQPPPAEKSAD